MPQKLTYDEAMEIAKKAQAAFKKAKTAEDVVKILTDFGKNGIGYRPLCKILVGGLAVETALKVYAGDKGS